MKVSENGIALIKKYEGCRLKAYKDSKGVLTIGWGHTANVKSGQTITQEEADALLLEDLEKFDAHVSYYDSTYNYKFNQNEHDALTSFAFNIGSLRGLTNYGKRTKYQIAQKIQAYVNCNGVKLNGLVKRRKAEYDLFITPVNETTVNTIHSYEVGKTYTTQVVLKVRKAPSDNAELVGYKNLTASGKKHDSDKNGSLDAGTKVTCKEVVSDTSGNTWIKIPSGYIASIYNGEVYVK